MNNGAMLYWIQRKKTVLLHEIAVRYHGSRNLMQHTAFLFKRIVQGLDFQNPDPFKQQGGENHGDNLCKGNRPPYHGQTGQYGEKVCRRKDHQELSRRRYDQAVDTISQSLKNRAYNDTVPGKDKAQADDTQRGHPDLQHMLGSVEKAQKLFWKDLEHGQPNEHDAYCQADAQLHGGFDPFSISGAVIVSHQRLNPGAEANLQKHNQHVGFHSHAHGRHRSVSVACQHMVQHNVGTAHQDIV